MPSVSSRQRLVRAVLLWILIAWGCGPPPETPVSETIDAEDTTGVAPSALLPSFACPWGVASCAWPAGAIWTVIESGPARRSEGAVRFRMQGNAFFDAVRVGVRRVGAAAGRLRIELREDARGPTGAVRGIGSIPLTDMCTSPCGVGEETRDALLQVVTPVTRLRDGGTYWLRFAVEGDSAGTVELALAPRVAGMSGADCATVSASTRVVPAACRTFGTRADGTMVAFLPVLTTTPGPSCFDRVRNGAETGPDCGADACGVPCRLGESCVEDADCETSARCRAVVDGASGSAIPGCGPANPCFCRSKGSNGSGCASADDCLSGACSQARCVPAGCTDGVRNGDESDMDCGGAACPLRCAAGTTCRVVSDCSSGLLCGADSRCTGSPMLAPGMPCQTGGQCASGVCTSRKCAAPTIRDRIRNGTETDVDCGGSSGRPCGELQRCSVEADCAPTPGLSCRAGRCVIPTGGRCVRSASCEAGLCVEVGTTRMCAAAPTCTDRLQDGDETGIDCGGSCPARCAAGAGCANDQDCIGSHCVITRGTGRCAAATCADGIRNGAEAATDCGGTGSGCRPCVAGTPVDDPRWCAGGLRDADGYCVDPSCADARRNGDESDVDCGGSCAPCPTGGVCASATDCASRACHRTSRTCTTPSAADGVRNGTETGVDCGGGAPRRCRRGQGCQTARDCDPSAPVCQSGICALSTCANGRKDAGERDLDCGGSCGGRCQAGRVCKAAIDCDSAVCTAGRCAAASRTDGVRNGSETDVDCGGGTTRADGCGYLAACGVNDDCADPDAVCGGDRRCSFGLCGNGSETCGRRCPSRCGSDRACRGDVDCAVPLRCFGGVCDAFECPPGQYRSGDRCLDCAPVAHCASGVTCTDSGRSRCAICASGFAGDGCFDVDECAVDRGGCAPDAVCTNLPGGFRCDCRAGFTGSGVTCADVDECAVMNGGCANGAVCTNLPGRRECACPPGDIGDGRTCSSVCEMDFPPLPSDGSGSGGGGPEVAPPDVDPVDVVSHWPLDGDWHDVVGGRDLLPVTPGGFSAADVALPRGNTAYGPTRAADGNGALGAGFTHLDLSRGATLEIWFYKGSNNTSGVLMGWGDGTWDRPELVLADAWGALLVGAGRASARVTATFDRPSAGCWHHLALVVPVEGTGALQLFVDGQPQIPRQGTLAIADPGGLFGDGFRLGTWRLSDSVALRLDEAKVWGRALSAAEVALRSVPRGRGERCPSTTMGWEPGPRCVFSDRPPALRSASTVRVLTDDTVVFITDPSDALEARLGESCGEYLTAMEAHRGEVQDWWWRMQYGLAATETKAHVLSPALTAWGAEDFLLARTCDLPPEPATIVSRWTQPVSEWRIPRRPPAAGDTNTGAARTILLTWARLPFRLTDGSMASLRDRWGNRVDLQYDDDTTVSWALKLSQVGFAADDPSKRVLLGHFQGPAGPMDLSRFEGRPFHVVREADGLVTMTGTVRFLADDTARTGEKLWSLDFGTLSTPGRYYVRLPGAGRTPTFTIGPDALGSAFLAHARGLYHNRCAPLDTDVTPWARGDVHAVYRALFPPDSDDYADHAAAGWGFRDAQGGFFGVSQFEAIGATATTERLRPIAGGWHDAGDFDRRPMHLDVVRDLSLAYLLAPANFSDGQLDLPADERNNGIPDVLDEAAWGLGAYRGAQQTDGGVGTWIEASSHPFEPDPGLDHQPYHLSLATRDSSLAYARHAALLARALAAAGASTPAAEWLQSAQAAWSFATRSTGSLEVRLTVRGQAVSWRERPAPAAERRMLAAVELLLATGDARYRAELESTAGRAAFTWLRDNAWWQLRTIDLASVAAHEADMPVGWATEALRTIRTQADGWRTGQAQWSDGWVWYPPDHRYVSNTGWGAGLYKPLREVVLAWSLTGDPIYKHAAQLGVAHLVGANAQGRSFTTGLGTHRFVTALQLPAFADGIAEVSPGITIYGSGRGLAAQASTTVWGLQSGARSSPKFGGIDMTLLPPPWDNSGRPAGDARTVVDAVLPPWRRLVPLETALPQNMEYTVWETVGPAVFVTGLLLEPGWTPSADLLADVPLDQAAWRDNLWMMP